MFSVRLENEWQDTIERKPSPVGDLVGAIYSGAGWLNVANGFL
jgi:hypothetical protein